MDSQVIQAIERQIVGYLSSHTDVSASLDEQTDLIESGILDSLLVTDLVLFIEMELGVQLAARDISPEHLRSAETISRLILAKRTKPSQAA